MTCIAACTAVHTRSARAAALLDLTVCAGEAGRAGAGVAALAGVVAGAAVLTGPVVGTEVKVLVTEESAPSFEAVAAPGAGAGAIPTARVPFTDVTELTLPAGSAPGREHKPPGQHSTQTETRGTQLHGITAVSLSGTVSCTVSGSQPAHRTGLLICTGERRRAVQYVSV